HLHVRRRWIREPWATPQSAVLVRQGCPHATALLSRLEADGTASLGSGAQGCSRPSCGSHRRIAMSAVARNIPAPVSAATSSRRLDGVRVMIVVPTFGLGGAERQAFLLARELAHREGAIVRLVSVAPPGIPVDLTRDCDREGLPWSTFTLKHTYGERFKQLWDMVRLVRLLRRDRPDVLLSY